MKSKHPGSNLLELLSFSFLFFSLLFSMFPPVPHPFFSILLFINWNYVHWNLCIWMIDVTTTLNVIWRIGLIAYWINESESMSCRKEWCFICTNTWHFNNGYRNKKCRIISSYKSLFFKADMSTVFQKKLNKKQVLLPGPKTLFFDRYYFHPRVCDCVSVCMSVFECLPRLSQKVLDRF